MPAGTLLSVENLDRQFGGITAVAGLSLALDDGELAGLIGPNGSGKTTTINMMAGALRPDRGRILLKGAELTGAAAHVFARRGIARTFQVPRLFRRMSVTENLMVPALTARGSDRREAEKRAAEVLRFLRLDHLAHGLARALSGGQQKLLELGRALMLRPLLLLLDEPFAGVHPELLAQIMDHIRRLNADGYTIVVVDHNLDAVRSLVGRMVVMAEGQKIADGASADVLQDPAVIHAYTGSRREAGER